MVVIVLRSARRAVARLHQEPERGHAERNTTALIHRDADCVLVASCVDHPQCRTDLVNLFDRAVDRSRVARVPVRQLDGAARLTPDEGEQNSTTSKKLTSTSLRARHIAPEAWSPSAPGNGTLCALDPHAEPVMRITARGSAPAEPKESPVWELGDSVSCWSIGPAPGTGYQAAPRAPPAGDNNPVNQMCQSRFSLPVWCRRWWSGRGRHSCSASHCFGANPRPGPTKLVYRQVGLFGPSEERRLAQVGSGVVVEGQPPL